MNVTCMYLSILHQMSNHDNSRKSQFPDHTQEVSHHFLCWTCVKIKNVSYHVCFFSMCVQSWWERRGSRCLFMNCLWILYDNTSYLVPIFHCLCVQKECSVLCNTGLVWWKQWSPTFLTCENLTILYVRSHVPQNSFRYWAHLLAMFGVPSLYDIKS